MSVNALQYESPYIRERRKRNQESRIQSISQMTQGAPQGLGLQQAAPNRPQQSQFGIPEFGPSFQSPSFQQPQQREQPRFFDPLGPGVQTPQRVAQAFAPPSPTIGPPAPGAAQQRLAQGAGIATEFAQQTTPEQAPALQLLDQVLQQTGATPKDFTDAQDWLTTSGAQAEPTPGILRGFQALQLVAESQDVDIEDVVDPDRTQRPAVPEGFERTGLPLSDDPGERIRRERLTRTRPLQSRSISELGQTVLEADRAIKEFAEPVTRPVGETLARNVIPSTPRPLRALGVPEIPIPGRETAESVAGEVSAEILNPANLIPIPVIDPLVAKAISLPFRAGTKVAPEVIRSAAQRARTLGHTGVADRLEQMLARGPVAGAAGGAPGRAATAAPPQTVRGVQEPPAFPQPEQFVQGQEGRFPGFERLPEFDVLQGQADSLGIRLDDDLVGGVDRAGEALQRAALPTQRQAEALSARMPIGEKARIATEQLDALAPDARPLSVDEVAARWGDRYKANWFTKLDDITAGARGRNRPLEKAVRDTMVTRDIYMQTEGMVQTNRMGGWIGRNADVLGLHMNSGRATAIPVREGADVPAKARQYLDDIVENRGDYVISPEQERALGEIQQQFETMKQSNFSHRVDFEAVDAETYWPRRVLDAPKGSNIPVFRGPGQNIAATPGFAKERQVPSRRQGIGAGVKYENPINAAFGRLVGGAEANANRWSVREIQKLGYKPSEKVSQRLTQNLKDAQVALRDARKTALKTRTSVDEETARQAAIQLDIAKASMRAEASQLSARSPKVFGRVVAPDIAEELSRYVSDETPGVIDDMFQLMRGTMVGADNSAMLLQNFALFWRNNPAWLKASAMGISAFKEAPYGYVVRNADATEQAIRLGFAHPPTEFLLNRGGRVSRLVAEAPVYKQSQRAFEWNVFIGQVERYKAAAGAIDDPQILIDMAAVTRKQGGIFWTPAQTRAQAKTLKTTFFAPQFLAAIQSTLTDPLLAKNAPARIEAMKSLAMMFGGATATTVGLHALLNDGELPNMTDPNRQGFWGVKVGGTFVHLLGPFQPLVTALAKTAQGDEKAFIRFFESKASLPVRWVVRAFEAMGLPLENVRGPAFSQPEKTFTGRSGLDTARDILPGPIGLVQTAEGLAQGEPLTALETLGGRTSIQSASDKFRRTFREVTGEEYVADPLQKDKARQNPQLAPLLEAFEQSQEDRGLGFAVERGEREKIVDEREQEAALPETAQRIEAGELAAAPEFREDIGELRKLYGELVGRDLFGVEFDAPETEAAQKYVEYIELRRNDFATDEDYQGARDTAFDAIPDEQKEIIRNRVRSQTPGVQKFERQLAQDRQAIEEPTFTYKGVTAGYWDVWDELWEIMLSDVQQRLPNVQTRGDLRALAGQFGEEQANSIQNELSAFVTDMRQRMRSSDPELDARLRFWGYTGTLQREQDSFDAFARLYPNTTPPRAAAN